MSNDMERFEAWHRREFPHNPLERNGPFGYISGSVRNRYRGWQAASACASALAQIERLLTNAQPHIEQACLPDHAQFIDAFIDQALAIARAAPSAPSDQQGGRT